VERLRRADREAPSAATQRLLIAIALSLSLHAFLLYQFASQPKPSSRPGLSIISARLAIPEPADSLAPESPPARRPGPERQPQVAPVRDQTAGSDLSLAVLPRPGESPSGAAAGNTLPDTGSVLIGPEWNEPESNESDLPEAVSSEAVAAPATAPAGLPDPVHYPAKELDTYPRLLAPVAAVRPERVRTDYPDGRVTLLLLIDETGRVSGVTVVEADPEGVFEEATVRAYSAAAFSPARKDGRAVRSRILVSVEIASSARVEGE
jgi:periplasmic protein TonB